MYRRKCSRLKRSVCAVPSFNPAVLFVLASAFICLQIYSTTRVKFTLDIQRNWQTEDELIFLQHLEQSSTSTLQPRDQNNTALCIKCHINCNNSHMCRNESNTKQNHSKVSTMQSLSLSSLFVTNYTSEKFTIIVPTYKRNYCIYSSLRHYCKMKYVAKIIVLWNNVGEKVPRYLEKLRCKAGLIIKVMSENRMTTRYIPFPEIQTEAILALDDDRLVTEESLMLAYRTWKKFRHKIIGLCSRGYTFDSEGHYKYLHRQRLPYSLILPNSAFIHRKYLDMFTDSLPRNLYDFIDDNMNVDDIAMNAMIANYLRSLGETQCSGFLVNGNQTTCKVTGAQHSGLWHRTDHNTVRSDFLSIINQTYNYMPLIECDIAITNIADRIDEHNNYTELSN